MFYTKQTKETKNFVVHQPGILPELIAGGGTRALHGRRGRTPATSLPVQVLLHFINTATLVINLCEDADELGRVAKMSDLVYL